MTAQAIMLALVGVPGIYFHSLFGSRGWRAGVERTGRNRTINRQKFDLDAFERELNDESSLPSQVFRRYTQILQARRESMAFHPYGKQEILEYGEAIFAVLRFAPEGNARVLCLHNISDQPQRVKMEAKEIFGLFSSSLIDLISGARVDDFLNDILVVQAYQSLWLRIKE